MNTLINLAKKLYELQSEANRLEQNNQDLENRLQENEENIVFAMMACTELYEMLISVSEVNEYGKDGVVKMASSMVKIYVNLIKRGSKTLDEVPEKLRAEVEAELEQNE